MKFADGYRAHQIDSTGDRTRLGIGFVLAHDAVLLNTTINTTESHRATESDDFGRGRRGYHFCRPESGREVSRVA